MANYDENQVKAVAEHSWWKYTTKNKLAEQFNLTENQIDELRATCAYRSAVLSLMVGQRLREDFEKWVKRYGPNMGERFGRRMGLDPEVVPVMVEQARQLYADIASGKARAPEVIYNPDKVEASEVKEIGKGSESVYLYYFPTYRRYAELLKEPNYPCNVGRTEGVVTNRVSQQIGDQLPEKPQLALILRTDNCRWLEARIHAALKRKGKQIEDAIGEEWFMTDPSEVKSIYQSIFGAD